MKIGVIGGGAAGIVSAYLLSTRSQAQVTLIEGARALGGHTNTVTIPHGVDAGTPVDTGFIVLNDRTYPTLHGFLSELRVPVRAAEMSFSFACDVTGLVYGSRDLGMIFAQRRNVVSPSFMKMLWDIRRFWQAAERDIKNGTVGYITLREYLERHQLTGRMMHDYIIPISAAMWSATVKDIAEFPALTFLRFFKNHGLLSYKDQPQWQTVIGGSAAYLRAFERAFSGKIVLSDPVVAVTRRDTGIEVVRESGTTEMFDQIVVATHADQALQVLANPTSEETTVLGAWRYQSNHCILHTDARCLPNSRRAWACWNYRREQGDLLDAPVSVTYFMNMLQGLNTQNRYFVTLNPRTLPDAHSVVKEITYKHPVYSLAALKSQEALPTINGHHGIWYCGSYHGFGFHEDAVRSAVAAVEGLLGQKISWSGQDCMAV